VQSIRMELLIPLLFAFIVVASGTILDNDMKHVDSNLFREFSNFKTKFNKNYSSRAEELIRLSIFEKNVYNMIQHNTKSGSTYKQGINAFSDLTDEEFKSQYLGGYKPMPTPTIASASPVYLSKTRDVKELPASVDWRKNGTTTDVKGPQGICGSCWAFTTTEMIESYVQINTGTLPVLSTQQVTSCTPNPLHCGGRGGCFGSVCQLGFNYVQLFGIVSEEDYPYTSGTANETTGECQYNLTAMTPVATITGYNTLPTNDQDAVLNHLANVGPLAISVAASGWGRYTHGVFDGCSYDENITINHAVQLVGYGTDEAEGDYWLARNSWGPDFGENGYIRLKRDQKAQCGVNSDPLNGSACVGGPGSNQQTVCGMCGMLLDASYPIGAQLVKN